MSSDPQPPAAGQSPRTNFFTGVAVAVLALGAMWFLLSSHRDPEISTPLPPINAAGWLNGSAPKPGELEGKVLVIDAWASWCGPCRQQAPEMVLLHEKYRDQVEFIGLTNEPEERLPEMEKFLKDTGIQWRNGYGADETLMALKADYIPMVWVVDRQQRIVWSSVVSSGTPEAGIRKALSSK